MVLAVIASMLAGTAATRADHTRIGSVTKTMIGTLVLELVDRHKLRLDESIAQWFPQLPEASQITIRKLFGFVPAFRVADLATALAGRRRRSLLATGEPVGT